MADDLQKLIDEALRAGDGPVAPVPQPMPLEIQPNTTVIPKNVPAQPKAADPLEDLITSTLGPAAPADGGFDPAATISAALDGPAPLAAPPTGTGVKPEGWGQGPMGYLDAWGGGIVRGIDQMRAAVPTLQGVYSEYQGDTEAASRYAAEAAAIKAESPEAIVGGFSKIKSSADALKWGLEVTGEALPILGATMIAGYIGGRVAPAVVPAAALTRTGLMSKQAAEKLIWMGGMSVGGAAVGIPFETADTAEELREVTKSYHPELSLAAGTAKGLLEIFTPLHLLNKMFGKGASSSVLKGIGGTMFGEGLTEAAQEEINIAARKYVDPSYDYFGAEALYRRLDSFAAGVLVGGVVGGPVELLGKKTAEKPTQAGPEADTPYPSPVSFLKRMMPSLQSEDEKDLVQLHRSNPYLDPVEASVLLETYGKNWAGSGLRLSNDQAFTDWIEHNTPRYAYVDAAGKTRVILNSTDLEQLSTKVSPATNPAMNLIEVNQKELTPAGVTAVLTDLPIEDKNFDRIFFLPNVASGKKKVLMQQYQAMINSPNFQGELDRMMRTGDVSADLMGMYNQLVSQGLRVLPSPGASFNYSGEFTGKEINQLPKSGRTYGSMDAKGASALVYDDKQTNRLMSTVPAYAIDLNKVMAGDVLPISYPVKLDEWHIPAGTDPAVVDAMNAAAAKNAKLTSFDEQMMQRIVEAGVVYKKPLKGFESLYINKNTDKQRLLTLGTWQIRNSQSRHTIFTPTGLKAGRTTKALAPVSPVYPTTSETQNALDKILSDVQKWLERKGLPTIPEVRIVELPPNKESNAFYYHTGEIELQIAKDTDLARALLMFFHEVGHHVTHNVWVKLPFAEQERILAGWRRHVLAENARANPEDMGWGGRMRSQADIAKQQKEVGSTYGYRFVEYLAEQFIKWSFKQAKASIVTDEFFIKTGAILQDLYNYSAALARKSNDPISEADRLEVDYTFATIMEAFGQAEEVTLPMFGSIQLEVKRESPDPFRNEAALNSILDSMPEMDGNPTIQDFESALQEAMTAIAPILPEGWMVQRAAENMQDPAVTIPARLKIIISMAAMRFGVGNTLMHETVHAVRSEGLFLASEWAMLVKEARADARLWQMVNRVWTKHYRQQGERIKQTLDDPPDTFVDDYVKDKLEEEAVAVMTGLRWIGQNTKPEVDSLLDRIIQFLTKLKNALMGKGFTSPADIRMRFFRGDITARENQVKAWRRMDAVLAQEEMYQLSGNSQPQSTLVKADKVEQVGDVYIVSDLNKDDATFILYAPPSQPLTGTNQEQVDQMGPRIGAVYLHRDPVKGWEVDMVKMRKSAYDPKVRRAESFSTTAYNYIEKTLGVVMKPSGVLLEDGYRMWMKRDPHAVRYHIQQPDGDYHSPNYIRNKHLYYQSRLKNLKGLPLASVRMIRIEAAIWKKLYNQVDKRAWGDPDLVKMFSLDTKDFILRTGQAMFRQERGHKENSINNTDVPPSGFDAATQHALEVSQAKNAKLLDLPYEMGAPESAELMPMKNIFKWNQLTPQQRRELHNVAGEADRLNWFSKRWWGINQMIWANPHFLRGKNYLSTIERWNALKESWIAKADTIAKEWDTLTPSYQRERLANVLFAMTEMEYLTPAERRRNVVRQPTPGEKAQLYIRHGLQPKGQALHLKIEQSFSDFLTAVEDASRANIQRQFVNNPTGMQAALLELQKDMTLMRNKPYFPMTRFGEWSLTVRDPTTAKVKAFYTFESEKEQQAYITVARSRWPATDILMGRVPQAVQEFIAMPAPLLKRIKTDLPNLTAQQRQWLDQLEHTVAPERSFRKHWLKRSGTPGYSLDAFRVYAAYFTTGAGYLARLRYRDEAQNEIDTARSEAKGMSNNTRWMLIDEMQDHLNYMLEGGRDHSKLKAFAAIWYLGFSPMAAGMNLTQLPMVTLSYQTKLFGPAAFGAVTTAVNALKATFGGIWPNAPWAGYEKARQEMLAQGKIDAGQAPELGSFASGSNLTRLSAGDAVQRQFRSFTYYAMWMFSKTERFNREATFASTFKLAMDAQQAGKKNAHLDYISQHHTADIFDLTGRVGLSVEEAIAFLAAREALDRTHFIYSSWARPKFMRNPTAATFLVFFQFIQASLYSMRNNPGAMQHILTLLFLFGLMAFPFAEDLDKIIEAIARRSGLGDWSPSKAARELIRGVTKGTVLDQVGPDLALHGISKFGFGMGLLPEGWGAPRFDASRNGSMGSIIPAVPDMVKGWGHYAKWNEIVGQGAQKASGAGYGYFFALLQFLSQDPHTAGYKKWEAIMPRAMKAASKGVRYGITGEEKDNAGATIARFNVRDPDDVATLLAQIMGAQPQKLTARYEYMSAAKETEMFYKGWRQTLYAQMDEALRAQDPRAQQDVLKDVVHYNKEVVNKGIAPINPTQLIGSLKNRARNRVKTEELMPQAKGSTQMYQRTLDMYPLVEQKKVK
jgi:hypothetical protein